MSGKKETFKYNDTTAGKVNQPVTLDGTNANQIILADSTDDPPLGLLAEDALQGQYVGVYVFGIILDVAAGGAISVGDKVGVTAEGVVNTIARNTTYTATATVKYQLGVALTAATTTGQFIKVWCKPNPIDTAS